MSESTLYDPIMDALMAALRTGCGDTFLTYRRGILMWEQLAQAAQNATGSAAAVRQPALFLYDGPGFGGGSIKYDPRGRGSPGVRTLKRTIVIYAKTPAPGDYPGGWLGGKDAITTGGEVLHSLIESVETVLNTNDSEGAFTLGRLVSHCWLEGDAQMLTPDIDPNGQGMATLPVRIMVP